MNGRLAVRKVLKESPKKYADIAREVGYKGGAPERWLSSMLASRQDLKLQRAAELLDTVGYKLVIMPSCKRTPDGGIEVNHEE